LSWAGACVNQNGEKWQARLAVIKTRAMPIVMVNERVAIATARIERALAQIEAASGAHSNANDTRRAFSELEARHSLLKSELHRTVTDLDQLIAHANADQV
jgi:uncharacterized small protein (DUF1192 family)